MSEVANSPIIGKLVEPEPEVLTFVGPDGTDLRSYLVELNQMYADNIVMRNKVVPVVQQLSKLYEEVSQRGVNRDTMQAMEHFGMIVPEYGVTLESRVPLMAYTERRSLTNQRPAMEAISLLTGGLIFAAGAAAIFLLYKMTKWLIKIWGKDDKAKKVADDAAKAASGMESASGSAETDAILAKIERSTERGPAVDMVRETFSRLVKDFGDLPGGSERALGGVTKGRENYLRQLENLIGQAKDLANDLGRDSGISDDDARRAFDIATKHAKPISSWPGFNELFRAYGVNIKTVRLEALGIEIEDVSGTIADLKRVWENEAKKPALQASKLAKNDMVIISKLLSNINQNANPEAGYFPNSQDFAKEIEEMSKGVNELNEKYKAMGQKPKPENAVNLAKLADLNQLLSAWGKLVTDYTTLIQFLLNRIGQFTAACTKFLTIYSQAASGKPEADKAPDASAAT